jgi:hypothetical protein
MLLPSRSFAAKKISRQAEPEEPLSLAAALAAEIQEESANDEVDKEYLDSKAAIAKTFKMSSEVGSAITTLTGSFEGEKIQVVFNCLDEEEGFGSEQFAEDEVDVDEGEAEGGFGINFEVTITKNDNQVVFKCVASGAGDIQVAHLQYVPKGKSTSDLNLYDGPKFDQLNETVVNGAIDYLAERGIDSELGYFILAHSAYKEQKEYENWLNRYVRFCRYSVPVQLS